MSAPVAETFLFADLAGFTALTEAHGDEQAADTATEFCAAVRAMLEEFEAQELKSIGDAVLIRAPHPGEAVELGLRIVEEIGSRPGAPVIRVGMHTGTAVERSGDWFGAAVNVAARVAAIAGGGEVLLTDSTREAAGALGGVSLHRHGEQRFKNVQGPRSCLPGCSPGERARIPAGGPRLPDGDRAGHCGGSSSPQRARLPVLLARVRA